MERRRLKRDMEALLGDYVGQRLREDGFDPKGKTTTLLDDLAHYDLAVSVALCWLKDQEADYLTEEKFICDGSSGHGQYPTFLERKAMILSSFSGMVLNSLPVKEVLSLYKCKPSTTCQQPHTKSTIVHPFTVSYHPFAMLSAYKAVGHSRKHTQMLQLWRSRHCKADSSREHQGAEKSPTSSSPQPSPSASEDSTGEESDSYEGSEQD